MLSNVYNYATYYSQYSQFIKNTLWIIKTYAVTVQYNKIRKNQNNSCGDKTPSKLKEEW